MLNRREVLIGMAATIGARRAAAAPERSAWMRRNWGIMVHWIPPGPSPRIGQRVTDLDLGVRMFNAKAFAQQIASTGAKWVIFTFGQNTGYYCSPNSILDRRSVLKHTSRRDLPADIIGELERYSIAFIGYLPAEVNSNPTVSEAFGWRENQPSDFQSIYTDFVGEYSTRYAEGLKGWWFDGCYDNGPFPNSMRSWSLWFDAARAGNDHAVVSFNNGCFHGGKPWAVHPGQDFLSGEASSLTEIGPTIGHDIRGPVYLVSSSAEHDFGCLPHAVAPIDSGGNWIHIGPGKGRGPTQSKEDIARIKGRYLECGWAVTFNVGVYQEGLIQDDTLKLLRAINV